MRNINKKFAIEYEDREMFFKEIQILVLITLYKDS